MFGLNFRASAIWLGVVLAALGALAASLATASWELGLLRIVLLLAVVLAVAERFAIPVQSKTGERTYVGISAAIYTAAALILPVPWAFILGAIGALVGPVARHRRGIARDVFNLAQYSLAAGLAAITWRLSGLESVVDGPIALPWIAATGLVQFLVNQGLVTAIFSASMNLNLAETFLRIYRNRLSVASGLIIAGALLAAVWSTAPWLTVLVWLLLANQYYAMRNSVLLEEQELAALFTFADIIDDRDRYTHEHSARVGEYARQLALAARLSPDEAHLVFLAGRLHDIGKCAIDNEVLRKQGPLDDLEREHMCIHPEIGAQMLSKFALFGDKVVQGVKHHHESWDGCGYPDRLVGDSIPLAARIVAIADAYDAMTSSRPYRGSLGHEEATHRLRAGGGGQWQAELVEYFVALFDSGRLTCLGEAAPTEDSNAAPAEPVPLPVSVAA